jgi:predicted dinucleotide-binding enzyme
MKMGIIGSGEIGGSLTRRLSKLGHEVFIANSRGPASLADLAAETGATAVTVHQAARSGEVVFVAIAEWRIPDLPNDLFDGVSPDVVVVDTGNYYPRERDGRIDEIEEGVASPARRHTPPISMRTVSAGRLRQQVPSATRKCGQHRTAGSANLFEICG